MTKTKNAAKPPKAPRRPPRRDCQETHEIDTTLHPAGAAPNRRGAQTKGPSRGPGQPRARPGAGVVLRLRRGGPCYAATSRSSRATPRCASSRPSPTAPSSVRPSISRSRCACASRRSAGPTRASCGRRIRPDAGPSPSSVVPERGADRRAPGARGRSVATAEVSLGTPRRAAASRLSAAIVARSRQLRVHRLRMRAERLLGHAVVAYMNARALEGGALGIA